MQPPVGDAILLDHFGEGFAASKANIRSRGW